jgi:hypothetical protein
VWSWLRESPATFALLSIISLTTGVQLLAGPHVSEHILQHVSSNLANILSLRLRVVVVSAFWLDGAWLIAQWVVWCVLFVAVLRPAERWLGTKRWIVVVGVAHIGATFVTAARLWLAIQAGRQPEKMADAIDVGVSYAFLGVVGLLTYRFPRRWRWPYALALAATLFVSWRLERNFTAAGHFTALLIGFGLYPLAAQANQRHRVTASA